MEKHRRIDLFMVFDPFLYDQNGFEKMKELFRGLITIEPHADLEIDKLGRRFTGVVGGPKAGCFETGLIERSSRAIEEKSVAFAGIA